MNLLQICFFTFAFKVVHANNSVFIQVLLIEQYQLQSEIMNYRQNNNAMTQCENEY